MTDRVPRLVAHRVGDRYPHPLNTADGMQAILDHTDEGLSLTLACVTQTPTEREVAALKDGPLRLGVYRSPSLVWLLLDAGVISYDAPYGIGVVPDAGDVLRGARAVAGRSAAMRGVLNVDLVDPARGNRVVLLRVVSASSHWWGALARSIEACSAAGPTDMATYRAAIARDQRLLQTRDMFARAEAVEIAGAI